MPTAWCCRAPSPATWPRHWRFCYQAIAEPKLLIVCGSEACSGGLFAESRAVDRSFLERYPVDLWLPGTPTHPMVFIDGILTLLGKKQRK